MKQRRLSHLREILGRYSAARRAFLGALGLSTSNRDPLSEFAESYVSCLLDGTRARSRTQKGWDVALRDGKRVQVKFLANRLHGDWVNEHHVEFSPEADVYALVVYKGFCIESVLVFPRRACSQLRQAFQCRDAGATDAFYLTECRYDRLVENSSEFEPLGVEVHWYGPS